jgi:hypothetical protein
MTSLLIEHLDPPASVRVARAMDAAGERAGELLAGRTVWCASALPAAHSAGEALRARMDGAQPGSAAAPVSVPGDDDVRGAAEGLERMLEGGAAGGAELDELAGDAYTRAAGSDGLFGVSIAAEDVVVVHDALSTVVTGAARERGAHVVWRLRTAGSSASTARRALEFLRQVSPGTDAFVITWFHHGAHGELVESIGAAMPAAGLLATKEFSLPFSERAPRRLAWTMALAEVVRSDRGECVGGRLHPCPHVAAR